jgi:peptide/nickel transport system substrate-binding protein
MVYDTLLIKQPDFTYAAGLATEWRVSPDGREVTLLLRPGVTFHDGARLDGPAVALNIERVMGGTARQFPVKDALGPLREVRASELQVTLVYDRPFPPVWAALSDSRLGIGSPASIHAAETGEANLTGSGPFEPSPDAPPGGELLLRRFAAYKWPPATIRNTGPAYPDKVKVLALDDSAPQAPAGLDILWWPAGDHLASAFHEVTDAGWRSYPFAGRRVAYLGCVLPDPVFGDPVVRQALRLVIDRETLASLPAWPVSGTSGLIASSLTGGIGEVSGPDPTAAARILSEAGWVPGEDGVRVRDGVRLEARLATYEGETSYQAVAAALSVALRAVGFDCRVVAPRRAAQPGLVPPAPNLWLLYHEWHDADVLHYLFHSSQVGRSNRTGYTSLVVDWFLDVARTEMDAEARVDFYRQAQSAIIGDGVAFGLFEDRGELRVSARVVGLRPYPAGELFLHDIYLRNQDGVR